MFIISYLKQKRGRIPTPLCASCHDKFGDNPKKRKWIRQNRDFWYEMCHKTSPPDPQLIREMRELINPLATKQDFTNWVSQLTSTLQQIAGQNLSSDVKLRQMSDATAAFFFATYRSLRSTYLVRKAIASQFSLAADELTDEQFVSVERLDLSRSEISDLAPLKELTNLESLWVVNTQVSDEEITALKKALPKLNIHG